jgi:hypothetical protein
MATKPNNSKTTAKTPTTGSGVKAAPAKKVEVEVKKSDVQKLPVPAKQTVPVEYDEEMLAAMGADAGAGVSTKAEDNIVPLIYILQALSPQVLRQRAEFIDGTKAGDLWFRGTKDFVDGDEGEEFILAHFSKVWIEWKPDRGGFVARHGAEKPADAQWVPDPKDPKRGAWEMPSGNIVVETREHVVVRVATGEPYVLPLSGSNHGVARDWMSKIGRKRIPGTNLKAPLWGYVWLLKTVAKSNDSGDWYGLQVEEASDDGQHKLTWLVSRDLYDVAKQLHADFESGVKQSDQGEEELVVDDLGHIDAGGAVDSDM